MKLYKSGHFSEPYTANTPIDQFDQKEASQYARTFPHSRKSSLIFRARALNLYENAINQPSTQILTYRPTEDATPYKDLNRYLTNLRKNYDLNAYCTALERTKKNTFHFHCIFDIPFFDTAEIKRAWASAIGRKADRTHNEVRDIRMVKSIDAVMKYCSDYLTKGKSKHHLRRKYSYSRNVIGGECIDLDQWEVEKLLKSGKTRLINSNQGDYCWTGRFEMNETFDLYYKTKQDVSRHVHESSYIYNSLNK